MLVLLRERLSLVRLDLPELRTRTSTSSTVAAVTQTLSFLYPNSSIDTTTTTPTSKRGNKAKQTPAAGPYICSRCIHTLAKRPQNLAPHRRIRGGTHISGGENGGKSERRDGMGMRRNYSGDASHRERNASFSKPRPRTSSKPKLPHTTTALNPNQPMPRPESPESARNRPPPHPYVSPHGSKYPTTIAAISPNEARQVLKNRISTFEEFVYHSDLYTVGADKLIDDPRWRNSHDLWRTITKFRKRVYGVEGVRHIWRGLRWRGLEVPLTGELGTFWWREFALAAGQDEAFRREVFAYIEGVGLGVGALWDLFFKIVLEKILFKDPYRSLDWIFNFDNQLDAGRTVGFLAGAMGRAVHMTDERRRGLVYATLRKFYLRWANAKIYARVMPVILEHRGIEEAMDWHKFLTRNKDFPPDSNVADPIFNYVAEQCPAEEGLQLLRSFVAAGSKIQDSTLIIMVKKLKKKRQVLDMLIGRHEKSGERARPVIWQPRLSDSFAAMVLSQIDIELTGAAHYLRAMGISTLFTASLHALYLRSGSLPALESTLTNLSPILRADPTALSTFDPNSSYPPLESHLRKSLHHSPRAAITALDVYLSSPPHTPLHRTTLDLVSITLLNRNAARLEAYLPTHTRHLTSALKIILSLHITGSRIPALTWRECILHLGWSGRLFDLEALLLWLAQIYKEDRSMLHRIFTPLLFYAMVEWPFLHFAHRTSVLPALPPPRPTLTPLPPHLQRADDTTPVEPDGVRAEPWLGKRDYTWGLRVVRKLREMGVRVENEVLKRAVRVRLRAVFGQRGVGGYSRRLEVRRWNDLSVQEVVGACEEALGERFLSGRAEEDDDGDDGGKIRKRGERRGR